MEDKVLTNAIVAYAVLEVLNNDDREKLKRKPQYRINPYLLERNEKGRFALDFEDMKRNMKTFHENFHMDVDNFEELFQICEKHLLPQRNVRHDAISPKQKFAATIEYLASGTIPRHLASVYRISKQHLGTIIEKVCSAIITELMPSMSEMNEENFKACARGFEERWQFPNCVGAMDGKHIALKAPPNAGSAFYNYKGFHSIVLFAVADWQYKFTYIDVGAYGSEGDANIFANSEFGKAIIADRLNFPQDAEVAGEKLPYFFLGDDAFPLGKRTLKPYTGRGGLSEEETIFNYRLSRARRCVENAFGILSIKWLCLKRTMFCSPERAQKIVAACCLLHNYLITKSSAYCPPTLLDAVDSTGNLINGDFRNDLSHSSIFSSHLDPYRGRQCDIGKHMRDKLKNYMNSSEGAVEWQREATFLE